ncbi:AAA domain-containing protein [Nocardiopsis metallicus]|uniref:Very-short-patch-repair endonuclease n=1 Tax=Nocardiopsis metallicus TaxID=179819 RepID=A0A840W4C0_9ACTN|nr:AAA domain-containing protein [Nocardiopsis metallicus]MBB5490834.1 very-short-patch-repair endonuclease [Nocardiopsis metallicus]
MSDSIAQALACPPPRHPHEVQLLLEAAVGLGAAVRPLPAWLGEEAARAAQTSVDHAEAAVAELREARAAAADLFGPATPEQQGLEELHQRLSGYGRLDRLGSAFREDKRRAATLTVNGSWDKRVPDRLPEAIRWQRAHRLLTENSADYQAQLGQHWRGEETDFAAVRSSLHTAAQLRRLLPEEGRSGLRRFLYQDQALDSRTVAGARAAQDELSPWEEAARQLLPPAAALFERPLEQAASWLTAAAARLDADADLADVLTPVIGAPVSTGTARAVRDCALRARDADRELRRHETVDQAVLGNYRELLAEQTRQGLVEDLDWAERVSQELRALTEPVLGPDCLDIAGIDSLRAQTSGANGGEVSEAGTGSTDQTSVGSQGKVSGALGRACQRDRSLAASLSHGGTWHGGLTDRIGDAQRWYEDHQALWGQAAVLGRAFGRYWQGEETDTEVLTAALDRAVRCRAELGEDERSALAAFLDDSDLTDLQEDLDQASRTLSTWANELIAFPGGSAQARDLAPAAALSWLRQVRVRMERLRELLSRFRRDTGMDVSAAEADRNINLARYRDTAETERELREQDDLKLLGGLYQIEGDLGETLQQALSWTRRARRLIDDAVGTAAREWPAGAVPALRVKCAPDELGRAMDDWELAVEVFADLFDELIRPIITGRLSGDLAEAERFLFVLREDSSSLERWSTALTGLEAVRSHRLGPLLERYVGLGGDPERWPDAVERAVLRAWTDRRLREDTRVRREPGPVRDNEVRDFRRRDLELHTWARQEVLHQWSERRPPVASYSPGLGVIRREAEKKRRHMPVRRLMEEATWEAQRLTPCLMMSPLTVSMFLPSDIEFDVVVFDEASQVKPADAINCIYRGRSLIVAGDQKQLPPTGFFDRATTDDEWDEEQQETYESLLDMCKASGRMRDIPLRWHYRSRHEDLIAFSNRKFYEGELITFPGAHLRDENTGVGFVRVENGVYDRGGARNNRVEARKVAERVVHHFRTRPGQTLGVVALSREQANAIEDEVAKAKDEHPELGAMFDEGRLGGFFVKNLETVQGDERDVIILSVGYGPAADGVIRRNFGPINRADGSRRLNVAVTRAKRRVEVVSSFSADDLRVGPDDAEGLRRLCEYLRYAEQGPAALEAQPVAGHAADADTESPFEDSVLDTLRGWGYEVQPQVGVAGYRIDLGVIDPELPGRYVIGIECDGAMYHSSKVARDRDRLRDGVLSGLGWRLHRIWGTDWYRDRARAQERLREAVEAAVLAARSAVESPEFDAREGQGTGTVGLTPDLVTVPDEAARTRAAEQASQQRPDWLVDYETHNYKPHDEAYWYEPRSAEARPYIAGLFMLIVEHESPVEVNWLYRKTIDSLGGERLGRTIRANFDVTLEHLLRKEKLWRDGDTIWWPGGGVEVRCPNGSVVRRINEVPPVERQQALILLVRDSTRITRPDLLRAMRETFEWGRSGKDITQAFEQDLETLLAKGTLIEEGDVIRSGT